MVPTAGSLATVLVVVLGLWAAARLTAGRARRDHPPRPDSDSFAPTVAAALVGVALGLIGPLTTQPLYWAAAAAAALSTAGAIGASREIETTFDAPAFAVPALTRAEPGAPGSISAAASVAGAAAAGIVAAAAFGTRLVGPSDPGLIVLAAVGAMLCDRWLAALWRAAGAARLVRPALAAAGGAAFASLLVVLLP